jgi:hypothetical protein
MPSPTRPSPELQYLCGIITGLHAVYDFCPFLKLVVGLRRGHVLHFERPFPYLFIGHLRHFLLSSSSPGSHLIAFFLLVHDLYDVRLFIYVYGLCFGHFVQPQLPPGL